MTAPETAPGKSPRPFLLFQLGRDRYALDIAEVVEILPLVDLKEVPQTPPGVAGVLNYRGAPVPVVDVSAALLGHPARRVLSTRLVLIRHPDGAGGERLLGLVLERATGIGRRDAADFVDSGVTADGAPCLGPVAADPGGLIQRVDPRRLLSDAVRDALFRPAESGETDEPGRA